MQALMKIQARFLAIAAPLVAGTCVAIAPPVRAASLAFSDSNLYISNFSHQPLSTSTFAQTNTFSASEPTASTVASASADSFFDANAPMTGSFSSTLAQGNGGGYLGYAKTKTQIIADFLVDPAQTFSFNFNASVTVGAAISHSTNGLARAAGKIAFMLFGKTENSPSQVLLGLFSLTGKAKMPEASLSWQAFGHNVSLEDSSIQTYFGDEGLVSSASFQGSYERQFARKTHLTLVEVSENSASVPEPSTPLAIPLFFFLLCVGYRLKIKGAKNKKLPLSLENSDSNQ